MYGPECAIATVHILEPRVTIGFNDRRSCRAFPVRSFSDGKNKKTHVLLGILSRIQPSLFGTLAVIIIQILLLWFFFCLVMYGDRSDKCRSSPIYSGAFTTCEILSLSPFVIIPDVTSLFCIYPPRNMTFRPFN